MSLRRLLTATPLAVLVAFAAHAAGFGTSHVLGGAAGPELLRLTLACLGLMAIFAFVHATLSSPAAARAVRVWPRRSSGPGELAALGLTLLAGGTLVFAGLEASEGHGFTPSVGWLGALIAAAGAVAVGARLLFTWLTRLGRKLAAYGEAAAAGLPLWIGLRPAPVPVRVSGPAHRLRRGRAPPR
jgi:hypothetical protein